MVRLRMRCYVFGLSVRRVAGFLGPERVWAERTHRVGRAGAENPVGNACYGPEIATGHENVAHT